MGGWVFQQQSEHCSDLENGTVKWTLPRTDLDVGQAISNPIKHGVIGIPDLSLPWFLSQSKVIIRPLQDWGLFCYFFFFFF